MRKTLVNSKKRDEILKVLRSAKSHPGARWIYEQVKPRVPGIALGTVYRNMKICRDAGLAASVGVINNEERFDGIAEPHPHAVCTKCRKIIDIEEMPKTAYLSLKGFTVDKRRTIFYGNCTKCQHKNLTGRLGQLLNRQIN